MRSSVRSPGSSLAIAGGAPTKSERSSERCALTGGLEARRKGKLAGAPQAADTATGALVRYVPAGPDRERLLPLVRLGVRFSMRRPRGPGFLQAYVDAIVPQLGRASFEALLLELELHAMKRARWGAAASPIERVDRTAARLTLHDPRRGRVDIAFSTLRNCLTGAKQKSPVNGSGENESP